MNFILQQIGNGLLILGICIFIGGGGLPPKGINSYLKLLKEYHILKKENGNLTLEHKSAYHTYCCYKAGSYIALIGLLICIASLIIGE